MATLCSLSCSNAVLELPNVFRGSAVELSAAHGASRTPLGRTLVRVYLLKGNYPFAAGIVMTFRLRGAPGASSSVAAERPKKIRRPKWATWGMCQPLHGKYTDTVRLRRDSFLPPGKTSRKMTEDDQGGDISVSREQLPKLCRIW